MERGGYGSQNPPPLFSRDDGDELAAVPTWDPLFSLFTNSSYFDRCIRGENPPGTPLPGARTGEEDMGLFQARAAQGRWRYGWEVGEGQGPEKRGIGGGRGGHH